MINLAKHIEILLLWNDCVIVPGLGGFMAYHNEAKFIADETLFIPPSRKIGFNPVLKMNDSLLVQSYIDKYDFSYPEALQQIEQEVEIVFQSLNEQGVFDFYNLGKLYKRQDGALLFEPFEAGILTPSLYALDSISISPYNYSLNQLELKSPNTFDEEKVYKNWSISKNSKGERWFSVKVRTIRDVAAAVVMITIVSVVALSLHNSNKLNYQLLRSGIFYNLIEDTSEKVTSIIEEKKTQQPIVSKKSEATVDHWSIVLASHITQSNADSYVQDLIEEGLKDSYVYLGAGHIKVLYGKYPTAEDATAALHKMRSNKAFKQSWIIKVKGNQ